MRLIIIFFFTIQFSYCQIYEVGISAGRSNFIGDIGETQFINILTPKIQEDYVYGLNFKWNRSPRHSYRFSYIFGELAANDLASKDPRRVERRYKFITPITELSLGMEFTFFDFNLHEAGIKYTPYIFTGIVYTKFNKLGLQNDIISKVGGRTNSFGIPFVLGFKYRILEQIIISAEVGSRFMFTDNIDGSVSEDENYTNFGNINNNDWYVFSLINLSYTFGRKPCYCNY
tara:strand:- start:56 stop:745 length:690 start_codon:yes stop_codon:yes gene_type:complete